MRATGAAPAPSLLTEVAVVAACVSAATLVRFLIGLAVPDVVPFATYFPAIALAALLAGFRAGLFTWLAAVALGIVLFMPSFPSLTLAQATSAALFAASAAVELLIASWLRDLVWQSLREEERHRTLIRTLPVQVLQLAPDGAMATPQPVWEQLTGERWPDYQGRAWIGRVHEEDRADIAFDGQSATRLQLRIWSEAQRTWRWFEMHAVPMRDPLGRTEANIATLADVTERKAGEERRDLVLHDLRHHLKNFIAVIHAIVTAATPKGNRDVEEFADTFVRRVRTLQSAADLVMKADAAPVDLAEVVPAAIAPFVSENGQRIKIDGPKLMLKEHTVGGIALACHELATNAAKYGALSTEAGRVSIRWHTAPDGEAERVIFVWSEHDGPEVATPTRIGFGTRIIKAAVAREAKGEVFLDYQRDGLVCRMSFLQTPEQARTAAA